MELINVDERGFFGASCRGSWARTFTTYTKPGQPATVHPNRILWARNKWEWGDDIILESDAISEKIIIYMHTHNLMGRICFHRMIDKAFGGSIIRRVYLWFRVLYLVFFCFFFFLFCEWWNIWPSSNGYTFRKCVKLAMALMITIVIWCCDGCGLTHQGQCHVFSALYN